MISLILSTQFTSQYEQLQKKLPQSLLLSGSVGVGLLTIAKSLSAKHSNTLVIKPARLTKTSTTKQISIEMIRELYDSVRTNSERLVIIDDADAMTTAAQNALLKLLEEPNSTTHFILTSHHPELLLPTIRSRVTTSYVPPVDSEMENDAIIHQFDEAKQRQLRFIGQGKPAELHRLSEDDSYFEIVAEEIGFAKKLISGSSYDRTVFISKMKVDREAVLRVVERAIDLLQRAPKPQTVLLIESLANAYVSIQRGGNPKLQLLNAML